MKGHSVVSFSRPWTDLLGSIKPKWVVAFSFSQEIFNQSQTQSSHYRWILLAEPPDTDKEAYDPEDFPISITQVEESAMANSSMPWIRSSVSGLIKM